MRKGNIEPRKTTKRPYKTIKRPHKTIKRPHKTLKWQKIIKRSYKTIKGHTRPQGHARSCMTTTDHENIKQFFVSLWTHDFQERILFANFFVPFVPCFTHVSTPATIRTTTIRTTTIRTTTKLLLGLHEMQIMRMSFEDWFLVSLERAFVYYVHSFISYIFELLFLVFVYLLFFFVKNILLKTWLAV